MNRILDYVKAEIKFHQDSGFKTDYNKAFYDDIVDINSFGLGMYDVGRYETLLELKEKIEEVIKNEK